MVQLEKGPAHLFEQVFMFGDVGIVHFGSNKAIFEHYSLSAEHTLFGFTPPQGSVQCRWCGMEAPPDCVGIVHSNREYSGYAPSGYNVLDLIIPQNWLLEQGVVDERLWRNSLIPEKAIFPLPNQQAFRFRDMLYNLVDNKSMQELLKQDQEMARLFREWILEEFLILIAGCLKVANKQIRVPSQFQFDVFNTAINLIDKQIMDPLSTSDLALQIGTSPRSLQYAFQKNIGVTPLQYILHRKLHAIRIELQRSFSDTHTNVASIAMLYSMTHLGRFSLNYKGLFGEPPSATLKQTNAKN
ncbi:MAG: helix-turn-helix transcriptional regulator [gamma proteobacterium endosymbiont of Lamellibrachia anaximandri]|nr:helix-turn-helix transcriptional regulator [gamma proteobacterium endosymbiont of Lamellibrachia anaximandri]